MAMHQVHNRVRVRAIMPPGHVRVPAYLRGKTGVIERALGAFSNPEQLAYGLPADKTPLYRVRFTMQDIWGEQAESPIDTIDAEIFAHWLEELSDAP
ncbi:SH3-like domain-containing protein [Thalassovita taeanensis]|uniref:Nitrile hydratase n=1 Tax=Thalassovita taeanensis TaxID=657014 RepID=A0A1H9HST4_9RHOB|nr:nitrile hydratase [Thalassovita taeanensis]